MDLRAPAQEVRSIQLYRTGQESALPIVRLGSDQTLTFKFDLMVEQGRPLSLYFYHADRTWRRDLSPSQFLESFQHDNILDYRISTGTQVSYVHYRYVFPNRNIQFLVSGNYVVRVTEQGDEQDVLFESAFFVTEQQAAPEFMTDKILVSGFGYPSIQPIVLFRPPPGTEGNLFDYNVCFVRNGRFELARCAERPSLMSSPLLEFYLEPEVSFEPEGASYFLDLSTIRTGHQITSADFTHSPFRIFLEPDFARFAGSAIAPLMNGQTLISSVVRTPNPDVTAEYVLVRFAYVPPDERSVGGDVLLTGSFNGWRYDAENRLQWNAERRRYEGELLLKQGQYEYRYVTRDQRLIRTLRGNMPRAENQYVAFVYYRDVRVGTDRLMAVQQTIAE